MSIKLITCDIKSALFEAYIVATFPDSSLLAVWVASAMMEIKRIPIEQLEMRFMLSKCSSSVLCDGYELRWLTLRLNNGSFLEIKVGLNRLLGDLIPVFS